MISYRRPQLDEAAEFAALHVQCWREAFSHFLPAELLAGFLTEKRVTSWQKMLAHRDNFVLGAFLNDAPVGFVNSGRSEQRLSEVADGHVFALYVAAKHHRQGIGLHLLKNAAVDWVAHGGLTLTVGVLAQNEPARRFYESSGAVLLKNGTYNWDGFDLPDCLYIWHDLATLAGLKTKVALR